MFSLAYARAVTDGVERPARLSRGSVNLSSFSFRPDLHGNTRAWAEGLPGEISDVEERPAELSDRQRSVRGV